MKIEKEFLVHSLDVVESELIERYKKANSEEEKLLYLVTVFLRDQLFIFSVRNGINDDQLDAMDRTLSEANMLLANYVSLGETGRLKVFETVAKQHSNIGKYLLFLEDDEIVTGI